MENDGVGHTKLLVARHHQGYQNLRGRMQQVASPTTSRKTDAELGTRMTVDAHFGGLCGETSRSTRLRRNIGSMRPNVQNGPYNTNNRSNVSAGASCIVQGQHVETTRVTGINYIGPRAAVCCTDDQGIEHNAWNTIRSSHGFPPAIQWTNQANEPGARTIPPSVCGSQTRNMARVSSARRICLQQQSTGIHQTVPILR